MMSSSDTSDLSMEDDLQNLIGKIAAEAKKRNPDGFTMATPTKSREVSRYEPFVTPSGQQVLFYNDAVNVPASKTS